MISKAFVDRLSAPLVVATHMRSGTHLTMDLVRRQFPAFRSWKLPGEANDMLYLALDVLSGIFYRHSADDEVSGFETAQVANSGRHDD